MNRLIAVAAAAIGGVVITRRKSIKDDVDRVKTAASNGAHKIDERVRGRSSDDDSEESGDSDEAVDLVEEEEALDLEQEASDGLDVDAASEEVSASSSN